MIRLKRLFHDGRALIVALDHGRRHGPIQGIEELGATLREILPAKPDAVMMTPAMIERYCDQLADTFVVARVDGTGTVRSNAETDDRLISSVARAVAVGADAVSVMVYPGSLHEPQLWEKLATVSEEAYSLGVPVIAEVVPKPPVFQSLSADVVAYGARIAAELGADVVKTLYVEGFEKVIRSVPVPVVILGGARASVEEVLSLVEKAVRAGAAGAAIGRNIFQHERPRAVVEALMSIIHRGMSAEEAAKNYLA